jgi:glycosyltransferase involved in cell wall biosynthesis
MRASQQDITGPIRVLFMQSQPFYGADTAIHAQLMRHFDRRDVEVHVACTTQDMVDPKVSAVRRIREIPDLHIRPTEFGPSIFGARGWDKARLAVRGATVPINLLSLAAYMRRHRIQIIHGTEKPRDAFYGVLLGKIAGARSVVHMHVGYEDWLSRPVKWAVRRADAVIGVSRFVAQTLVDGGAPSERVFAVHNSLDLDAWNPDVDGGPIRRALGIDDDAPVVGIVSRLFRWKGHGHLLDALAIVKQDVPAVRLVIVGEDDPRADPGSGSYRAELEAQARRLGVQDHVIFTGFRTDIPQLMASFDVFAHPSWEEPFGMVFLEAMAMQKPVVAWRSGGAPEVIVDGETGVLAERGSIPSLAEALLGLVRDKERRRRLGTAGRRRVEEVFTPQHMCRSTLEAYAATLKS